ncbi:MAG: DUF1501 domain-containing protein, partial [Bdellovibrionales bacterium]|nr:DUF1501 domain-containing protein [Bdellovibrionales bacterium]
MKTVSRRNFLRSLSYGGTALFVPSVFRPSFLCAQSGGSGNGANVIIVNLLGGLDGLAAFPLFDGGLVSDINTKFRPSLAVSPGSVLSISAQGGVSNKIGLHPEFAPLVRVVGDHMKIIQGYGIPGDPGRSHDTCQVIMSLGRTDVNDPEMRGFLARVMDHEGWEALQYWAFDVTNPSDVNTEKNSPVRLSDVDSFSNPRTWWEDQAQGDHSASLRRALLALQRESTPLATKYQAESEILHSTLEVVQHSIVNQSVGGNSEGDYSEGWGIGPRLRSVAKILKAKSLDSSLSFAKKDQVFLVTQDGYDTHGDQNNTSIPEATLAMRLRELAHNLAVFYRDVQLMGAAERTYVVVYSEFGRTVRQNSLEDTPGAGSDHGHGNNTIVFGGGITPGVIGDPPTQQALNDEDYNALVPTIDYRDVFSEIFAEVMGIAPE